MAKKTTEKKKVDEVDELNEFEELDLGLDEDKTTDSINKGLESGATLGFKSGAREAVKPLAEEASKKVINELLSGGGKPDPVSQALKDASDAVRLEYLKSLLEKKSSPQLPVQHTDKNPVSDMVEMMNLFKTFMEMMGFKKEEQTPSVQAQILPYFMQMMNQQQQHAQPVIQQPQGDKGLELVVKIMEQNQQLQMKIFELQNMAQQQQTQYILERLEQNQPPNFAEQLKHYKQIADSLGLSTNNTNKLDEIGAQFELERYRLAQMLEKEKLALDKELRLRELQQQEKSNEIQMFDKIANTIANLTKNLNLEMKPQPNPYPYPQEHEPAPPKPLTTQISDRINKMLRINSLTKQEDSGDESDE